MRRGAWTTAHCPSRAGGVWGGGWGRGGGGAASRGELDFFASFSSIASVWGSLGQAAYAAANAFLDGLAHYQRQQGVPGQSINFGPWSGGGLASEQAQQWLTRT